MSLLNNVADAHTHLNNGKENSLPFQALGGLELLVSTSPDDWVRVVDCAKQHGDAMVGAVGVHPWFLENCDPKEWMELMDKLLQEHPEIQVGEIGLDFAWKPRGTEEEVAPESHENCLEKRPIRCSNCLQELQIRIFRFEVEMGIKHGRNLSIHCVRVHQKMVEILAEMLPSPNVFVNNINLHSWNASPEMTRQAIQKLGKYHLFLGVSMQVNARGLIRYELDDTNDTPEPRRWFYDEERNVFLESINREHTSESPWKLDNPKGWEKFKARIKLIGISRLLLETDVPGTVHPSIRRKSLKMIAKMCADALETSTDVVFRETAENLKRFLWKKNNF